jgi:hypothetical protein
MVSILLSIKVFLKEETLGLYLIFNCRSPSYKKICSKSALIISDSSLLDFS